MHVNVLVHQTEKHPKSWNFWGDRIFTNFQQWSFPKKWRQISKIVQSVKLRAKHTSFYMDHKAIQYSACSVHFATANFQSFPVWMQTIKTSIWRYSGEKNHSGLVGWLYYCFTALRHILGHFERGHLAYPHCSWASLLGSLPVLKIHLWRHPIVKSIHYFSGM